MTEWICVYLTTRALIIVGQVLTLGEEAWGTVCVSVGLRILGNLVVFIELNCLVLSCLVLPNSEEEESSSGPDQHGQGFLGYRLL